MRFGHYTVFDTPDENKHTQVYVEYDVPNNDNLDGATGTMVLSDGNDGANKGNGIKSITISPSITTTPALDTLFPIYYEDLTEEQKQSGVALTLSTETALTVGAEYTFTITPTADMYFITDEPGAKGEPNTVTAQVVESDGIRCISVEEIFVTTTLEEPTVDDMVIEMQMQIRSTVTPK